MLYTRPLVHQLARTCDFKPLSNGFVGFRFDPKLTSGRGLEAQQITDFVVVRTVVVVNFAI